MSFCEPPNYAINRHADAGDDQQRPENKCYYVVCTIYGSQAVRVVEVQDGEQAAQVIDADGEDDENNGHGFTSGGLGSGIQWVTFTKSGKYSSLNHTSKSSSLHAI